MRPPRVFLPLLALAAAAFAPRALAQTSDEPPAEELKPVALLSFAGVDRARSDVGFLFETVDRGDMTEVVDGYLDFVNDLDGVDKTKPLGVMLFLKPGFVPIPAPVGFVPVTDVQALRESVSFGDSVSTEKLRDDLFEIKGPRNTLFALIAGGYALVSNEREFLEENRLPAPLPIAGPLAARSDVAVAGLPKNIPPGMRSLFQNFLRQNTQTQMQRRDNEPEAAFRVRKAQAKRNLEVFEAMLEGSDAIRLAIDASAERRTVEIELDFEAIAGTKWAEAFAQSENRATPFDVLYDGDAPLSVVAGTQLAEWDVEVLTEQITVGQDEIAAFLSGLRPENDDAPESPRQAELVANREAGGSDYDLVDPAARRLAEDVTEPILVTVENKELDFMLQFRRDERPGGMTILGAARIGQSERFAAAVPKLLERIAAVNPEFDRILTLNVETVDDVTWHEFDFTAADRATTQEGEEVVDLKVPGTDETVSRPIGQEDGLEPADDDDIGVRFFGGRPSLHLGLGRDAVWVVVGADGALEQAQTAVRTVREQQGRLGAPPRAAIRAAVNVTGWFGDTVDADDEGALRGRDAFDPDNDRATIDFLPTPAGGGRLRVVLDEGFLRFLALSITDGYDQSQL